MYVFVKKKKFQYECAIKFQRHVQMKVEGPLDIKRDNPLGTSTILDLGVMCSWIDGNI